VFFDCNYILSHGIEIVGYNSIRYFEEGKVMTFKNSKDVIDLFESQHAELQFHTSNPEIRFINPQKIIGIRNSQTLEELMNGYKMELLKKSVDEHGWTNEEPHGINLLELPNGDLVVRNSGNRRAVLAKC